MIRPSVARAHARKKRVSEKLFPYELPPPSGGGIVITRRPALAEPKERDSLAFATEVLAHAAKAEGMFED